MSLLVQFAILSKNAHASGEDTSGLSSIPLRSRGPWARSATVIGRMS